MVIAAALVAALACQVPSAAVMQYDDEFVRTAEGWRMTRRAETKCIQKVV